MNRSSKAHVQLHDKKDMVIANAVKLSCEEGRLQYKRVHPEITDLLPLSFVGLSFTHIKKTVIANAVKQPHNQLEPQSGRVLCREPSRFFS